MYISLAAMFFMFFKNYITSYRAAIKGDREQQMMYDDLDGIARRIAIACVMYVVMTISLL